MLSQAFELKNINKYTRILDPSCGGGYFLIEAFKKIKKIKKSVIEVCLIKLTKLMKL